jgi:phosphoribosylformimino-5-aminoimidazole carboxamide ribotide isomerase
LRFRPCIDLHDGLVKQIVGASLSDSDTSGPTTNFQTRKPSTWYADLYRRNNLIGGHVIQLGKGNEKAAREALGHWPGGMQLGGGVNADNATHWLDAGASHVIVTSWVFSEGRIHLSRLKRLTDKIGKKRLVLDLSCRKRGTAYRIATNRWQTFTSESVTYELMDRLSAYCDEFLIHAVDVEGKCSGIESELVDYLGKWEGLPVTYAGGIADWKDIDTIDSLGRGNIDFTVGSALDIFGGANLRFKDLAKRYSR